MTTPLIVEEAEAVVRDTVVQLTRIRPGECLCCYVWRLLDRAPCDNTLRHALRYRDERAPRATALADRLGRVGGYCDCEVFLNGYEPRRELWTPRRHIERDGVEYELDPEPVDPIPRCRGVGRGSVQPCAHWQRLHRRR